MSVSKKLWALGAVAVMGSAILAANPAGTDSTAAPKRQTRTRLTRPWSELKDLTSDEKSKILEIHQKAVDQVHEIEAQEHKDILALLTDQQRKEVADLETKQKEQQRENRTRRSGTASSSGASPTDESGTK